MPRSYRFRVSIVEAVMNRKKDQQPLDCSSPSNVRNEIVELLERLAAKNTLRFPPREPVDGEPQKPTRTATLTGPAEVSSELVHLELVVGETGRHGYATHAVEPPMNIKDRSAEQPHRITLVFSPQSMTRFVVVCQTIHRRDAVRRFFQILTDEGLRKKQEIQEDQKRQKELSRVEGERPPAATPPAKQARTTLTERRTYIRPEKRTSHANATAVARTVEKLSSDEHQTDGLLLAEQLHRSGAVTGASGLVASVSLELLGALESKHARSVLAVAVKRIAQGDPSAADLGMALLRLHASRAVTERQFVS